MFGLLAGENTDMLCQTVDASLVVRMAPNRDKGKQILPDWTNDFDADFVAYFAEFAEFT